MPRTFTITDRTGAKFEDAKQAAFEAAIEALTINVDGHEQAPGPLTLRVKSNPPPRKARKVARPFIAPPTRLVMVRTFTFTGQEPVM